MNNLEFNLDLNAKGFMGALQDAGADIAAFAMRATNKFAETGGVAGRMGRAVEGAASLMKRSLGGITDAVGGTITGMHRLNGAFSLVNQGMSALKDIASGAMGMAQLAADAQDAAEKLAIANGDIVEHKTSFNELKDGLIKGWQEVQIEFAKPIIDTLKPFMEQGVNWLEQMKPMAAAVGESIAQWAEYIGGAFKAGEGFSAIFTDIKIVILETLNQVMKSVDMMIAKATVGIYKMMPFHDKEKAARAEAGVNAMDGRPGPLAGKIQAAKEEREGMRERSAAANETINLENTGARGRKELQALKDAENKKIQDENKAQADADQKFREDMMDGNWNFDTNELIDSAKEQKQAAQEQKNAAKTQLEAASKAKLTATPAIGRALGTLRSFAQEMQGNGAPEGAAPQSKAVQRMSIQDRVKQGIPTTMQERIRAGLVKPNLGLSTQPAKTKAEEQQGGQSKDAALLEAVQQILQFFQKQLSPV